jgi:hypothetical protein
MQLTAGGFLPAFILIAPSSAIYAFAGAIVVLLVWGALILSQPAKENNSMNGPLLLVGVVVWPSFWPSIVYRSLKGPKVALHPTPSTPSNRRAHRSFLTASASHRLLPLPILLNLPLKLIRSIQEEAPNRRKT